MLFLHVQIVKLHTPDRLLDFVSALAGSGNSSSQPVSGPDRLRLLKIVMKKMYNIVTRTDHESGDQLKDTALPQVSSSRCV